MKKLLAILLILMTPLCVMAETYGLTIRVEAGSEAFLRAVQDGMVAQGSDVAAAEKEAALVQKLVDGLGLDFALQEEAYSMVLRMCGEPLFDMTGYETSEKTLITSSMLPGYALTSPVEDSEAIALDETDWTGAVLSTMPALDAWLAGIEKTERRGIFVGDAYEGGSKCTTWQLNDQDVAAMMEAVLNEDTRAALSALYEAMGFNAAQLLGEFDNVNANVARENRYTYLLRVIQDEKDALVGVSLTISQDEEQVSTFSLGVQDAGMKLVIGLGLEQQNYWCEITTSSEESDEESACTMIIREWAASKEAAFAYVQGAAAPANVWVLQMKTADEEKGYAWNGSVTANGALLLTTSGHVEPADMVLHGVVALVADNAEILHIQLDVGSAAAIPALDASLVECSTTDPADALLYEKLNTQLTAAISARLLKLLPMEQILQMNPFALP